METASRPFTSGEQQIPPALGYSAATLALWIFRRPIIALAGLVIHLAFSLAKPALLVLGLFKVAELVQPPRNATDSPFQRQSAHPGDDEALLIPARTVSSATSGVEV